MDWLVFIDRSTEEEETIRTRYVLSTLYFSTQNQGDSKKWSSDFHWLSSYPVCLWYGVECFNEQGTIELVKSLNLSSNLLAGTIPDEIGLLGPEVQILDLSNNEISGTIPGTMSLLANLGTSKVFAGSLQQQDGVPTLTLLDRACLSRESVSWSKLSHFNNSY